MFRHSFKLHKGRHINLRTPLSISVRPCMQLYWYRPVSGKIPLEWDTHSNVYAHRCQATPISRQVCSILQTKSAAIERHVPQVQRDSAVDAILTPRTASGASTTVNAIIVGVLYNSM